MTLEQRAIGVLEEAHDLIKGESSFKTAQKITYCDGEYWDAVGIDGQYVEDEENEIRPYIFIKFENPKNMGRESIRKLEKMENIRDRDLITIEGASISITVIGEPVE